MVDSGTYETVPIIRIPDAYPELMAFSHSGLAFQVNHTGLSYQVDGVRCSLIFTQAEGSTLGFQEDDPPPANEEKLIVIITKPMNLPVSFIYATSFMYVTAKFAKYLCLMPMLQIY
ncbi:hypothetical protein BED35_04160 [Yersinia enterocolitica]|nr:hypothetical protein BB936_03935 [Yersinia enterocolitica]AOF17853.1 hypothetical protein BED34_03710 [Yersinia enterocolitica]AOF22386.1 hypothetical protein BED33_06375 [Yersinia enterocolitica]AOF26096.1 hypothetical protein BED32_03685 [Yersinia enterocolitica]AOF30207.1 hypothetical protein BED35_04160 [Yersinia enterocolitica]